jgi:hypothetical protein
MLKTIRVIISVAVLLSASFLLIGCDEDPVIEKSAKGQSLTPEETQKYYKNKENYDKQIAQRKDELAKEAIVEKLARGDSLTSGELELYNKDAKRFNDRAASRKEELTKEAIVAKIINGDQLAQDETLLYNKNQREVDNLVSEKRKKLMKDRILAKLARGDQLNVDEAAVYTDNKKALDEEAIGLKAGKQTQPTSPQQPTYVDRLPVAEAPKREIIPGDKSEYLEVYFEPIPRIPYLKKK